MKPGRKKQIDKENKAALCIQKHWKGHIMRKKYSKMLKRYRKKKFVVQELLQSQRTYCENLEYVVKKILMPGKILIKDQNLHRSLFSNIQHIWKLHSHFLGQLEKQMKDFNPQHTKISGVLMNHLFNHDNFKQSYTQYCYDYKNADQAIKIASQENSAFYQHLKKLGLLHLNLSLESYMIKPVQRLCKYGLLIGEYHRNMEPDHIDYKEIDKTGDFIEKLVQETNDQVEQFLMRERLLELKNTFPNFFNSIHSAKQPRMFYESKEVGILDILEEQEVNFKSVALFENSIIMIPHKITEDPIFYNFLFGRELTNNKYYKNIVQLVDNQIYTYLQFKEEKDKKQFMKILNKKLKQDQQQEYQQYIKITILGTQTRQSFFSSYTVYIVNIEDRGKTSTIYPRFKDLLKVQDLMVTKGMKFDRLLLSKESIIATLKPRTIEKRKHTIQEFLEKVFNNCQISEFKQIEQILGFSQLSATAMMPKLTSEMQEVWVYLPNMQKVKVMISVHDSQIRDLKHLISERMGMESTDQFEIFQVRNKNYNSKKLLYDGQPVKKIYDEQKDSASSINPFRDAIDYLYSRHYYLSKSEEEELYKCDQARSELQLSVIHAQILNYRLDEEVMLTFMCLFAIYIHLPVENQQRLNFFIREITKKSYKVTEEEFRIYFVEVKKMLASEDSLSTSLPLIIIKIISNSYLYQCLQFDVLVHRKVFDTYKKIFNKLEDNITLGLHPEVVYLLHQRDKNILAKFSYSQLNLIETRPNSIVLEVLHNQTPLILKTPISFEISKLFEIYRNKH